MDPLAELDQLQTEALSAISHAQSADQLEQERVRWLGRKSRIIEMMKLIPTLPPESRGPFGQRANQFKKAVEQSLAEQKSGLAQTPTKSHLDVTLPGQSFHSGTLHPITQTLGTILSLFTSMGFEVADGPEMEFEYYNFDGLNIPKDHPSRESFDTFFVDYASPNPKQGRMILRSHTSPVQVRVLEKHEPPLRIVVPGRVYRRDALDPGHSFMFHQVEGLMVDKKTRFSDLKGILDYFLRQLFGPETKTRFRPHYFPFTEPSAEIDIASHLKGKSSFAQKEWLEIMGCGMVHPNVLQAAGYDPKEYQGFAFGMGVERITMLRHGIQDIRSFFESDVRFLEQF